MPIRGIIRIIQSLGRGGGGGRLQDFGDQKIFRENGGGICCRQYSIKRGLYRALRREGGGGSNEFYFDSTKVFQPPPPYYEISLDPPSTYFSRTVSFIPLISTKACYGKCVYRFVAESR